MKRRLTLLLVLGCVSALLSAGPTWMPASASGLRGSDPRGDGERVSRSGDVARSAHANGDIVGYRVSWDRNRLRIEMRYRALNFTDPHLHAGATLWSGTQFSAELAVVARRGSRAGRSQLAVDRGARGSCRVAHRISYRNNRIVLRVPSECLPDEVFAQLVTYTTDGTRQPGAARIDLVPGRVRTPDARLRLRRN